MTVIFSIMGSIFLAVIILNLILFVLDKFEDFETDKVHDRLLNAVINEFIRRGFPPPRYVDVIDDDDNAAGRIQIAKEKDSNKYIFDECNVRILNTFKDNLAVHAHELGHLIACQDHNEDMSEERADFEAFRFCFNQLNWFERQKIYLKIYFISFFYDRLPENMKEDLRKEYNLKKTRGIVSW